ncbi:hypothetical protein N7478_007958 [Penicillium angulare]|uniref:uncharacterized protein n=1 Tax=Penicillium angulare TaxID=116970 RepID=UPI00254059DC|nr:uncharacterized protein N7478_007958 [Penicillium angulare]KAJ5272833.1 hypothetical protein N7478_007958 [Penicillium angulare]
MALSQQKPGEGFLIRHLQSSDIPIVAHIAATEYFDSELNSFLCPHRHKYPDHVTRRFTQMIQGRSLDPRNIGFVAADALNPSKPVAYAQFIRLGHDQAAVQLVATQSSVWLTLRRWWFKIHTSVVNFFWPDRSIDPAAMGAFMKSVHHDTHLYWGSPEMKSMNRWHTQSVVVSSFYQRLGLGRRLMDEVLRRAQDEGVVVDLEASEDGEKLYQNLGFQLRGPFSMVLPHAGLMLGGFMMWSPQ